MQAQSSRPQDQVIQIIQSWPDTSKKAAKTMIEQYGPPDGVTQSMLVWEKTGPWKRTIVYKEEIDHDFPMPHKDVLEQFISYKVPEDKFDELAQFDGSLIPERTKGEISARCDKEGANFLAINLAHDLVQGNKTVEQARQEYADAVQAFMEGQPPRTMKGFTFEVPRNYTGDPGQTILKASQR